MTTGLALKNSERVLLVGKTGSGKTFLARLLLSNIQRLIVIDSKWRLNDWQGETLHALPARLPDRFRWIVRTEEPAELGDQLLQWEDYYLYVDELYAVFPSAQKMIPAWRGLWTRGRESNIAVWAGVQRPSSIPLVALSEAEHYFVFRLNLKEDRDRMSGVLGVNVRILPRYSFLYADPSNDVYWQVGQAIEVDKPSERAKLIPQTLVTR